MLSTGLLQLNMMDGLLQLQESCKHLSQQDCDTFGKGKTFDHWSPCKSTGDFDISDTARLYSAKCKATCLLEIHKSLKAWVEI